MTIFEIDNAILECVDLETGEIIDADRLDALQMERETKIENVALWQKECIAEAEAIAAEIRKLQVRKAVAEHKAESLKSYLVMALEGQKFKTSRVSISYRRSQAVIVDNEDQLDPQFIRIKTTIEPDKTAIKDALKTGEVTGAHLEERNSIIIQ